MSYIPPLVCSFCEIEQSNAKKLVVCESQSHRFENVTCLMLMSETNSLWRRFVVLVVAWFVVIFKSHEIKMQMIFIAAHFRSLHIRNLLRCEPLVCKSPFLCAFNHIRMCVNKSITFVRFNGIRKSVRYIELAIKWKWLATPSGQNNYKIWLYDQLTQIQNGIYATCTNMLSEGNTYLQLNFT